MLENHNVINAFQLDWVQKKAHSSESKEKAKETNLKNLNVENPFQSEIIKEKIKKTHLEKRNVEYPSQDPEVQAKSRATMKEKTGYEYHLQNPENVKKLEDICEGKFGVKNFSQTKEFKKGIDWQKASQKRHETKKKFGNYSKSKIEDEFFQYLLKRFLVFDIMRGKLTNSWSIDFYIKSLGIFIQFDGTYFHGLDRPIEIIKNSNFPRDKTIYETYLRDQNQEAFFTANNLKLYRISDKMFKKFKETNAIFQDLLEFSDSSENIRKFY